MPFCCLSNGMDVVIMIFPSRLCPDVDRTKDIHTLSAAEWCDCTGVERCPDALV